MKLKFWIRIEYIAGVTYFQFYFLFVFNSNIKTNSDDQVLMKEAKSNDLDQDSVNRRDSDNWWQASPNDQNQEGNESDGSNC